MRSLANIYIQKRKMITYHLILLVGIPREATLCFPSIKRSNIRALEVCIPVGWAMVAKVPDDQS